MYVKFLEGRSLANEKLENEVAREFWTVSYLSSYFIHLRPGASPYTSLPLNIVRLNGNTQGFRQHTYLKVKTTCNSIICNTTKSVGYRFHLNRSTSTWRESSAEMLV